MQVYSASILTPTLFLISLFPYNSCSSLQNQAVFCIFSLTYSIYPIFSCKSCCNFLISKIASGFEVRCICVFQKKNPAKRSDSTFYISLFVYRFSTTFVIRLMFESNSSSTCLPASIRCSSFNTSCSPSYTALCTLQFP